jgi:hypothetical protein
MMNPVAVGDQPRPDAHLELHVERRALDVARALEHAVHTG